MAFNSDEPRDKNGEWTRGGGTSAGTFSDQQNVELKDYAEGNYQVLNAYLHNPESVPASLAKEYDKQIKTITGALGKSKLTGDVTVFRGVQSPKVAANAERLVGRTISAPGFQSTSRSVSVAQDFAGFGQGSLVLQIHAKAGTPAINMERFKTGGNSGEQEILFGHHAQLRITGVDRSQRIPVIKAEFV